LWLNFNLYDTLTELLIHLVIAVKSNKCLSITSVLMGKEFMQSWNIQGSILAMDLEVTFSQSAQRILIMYNL
jgi:hypothetical protein